MYLFHGFVVVLVLGILNHSSFRADWPAATAAGYTALLGVITFCLSLAIHRYYAEPLGRALRRVLGGRQKRGVGAAVK